MASSERDDSASSTEERSRKTRGSPTGYRRRFRWSWKEDT